MNFDEVRHAADRDRYELLIGGRVVGVADYRTDGDRVVMYHTRVEPALRHKGLAAELVRGALDDLRATGRRVEAECWYVAGFIESHPEYADMLAVH